MATASSAAEQEDSPVSSADSAAATAADKGVWTSADGTTVTYDANFFSEYQTVSAADMLR